MSVRKWRILTFLGFREEASAILTYGDIIGWGKLKMIFILRFLFSAPPTPSHLLPHAAEALSGPLEVVVAIVSKTLKLNS
jgi:hypothetical protein